MSSSKDNPVFAYLYTRYRLNEPISSKETWHIGVDISGSGINYKPGDCLGVIPKNPRPLVDRLLRYFELLSDLEIEDPRTKEKYPLFHWLHERVDITILSEKLFSLSLEHARSSTDRKLAEEAVRLYNDTFPERASNRELSWYRGIDVPTFFEKYLPSGVDLYPLLQGFTPIIPRFYSIASSPLVDPHKIELLLTRVEYPTEHGIRVGLASHYLVKECQLHNEKLKVFLQPTKHFILPEAVLQKEKPLVMVGPGTGVAPFRAFVQHMQTLHPNTSLKDKLWLFFGERNKSHDFIYKVYWQDLTQRGFLSFDAVFSRDTDEKKYVQNRMWERKSELFYKLYHEEGYFYVCGDAKKMAKDVEAMLLQIIMVEGKMGLEEAQEWLRLFRKSGRYQRDVY